MTDFTNHPDHLNIIHLTSYNNMKNRLYEEQRYGQEDNGEITDDLNVNSLSTVLNKIIS